MAYEHDKVYACLCTVRNTSGKSCVSLLPMLSWQRVILYPNYIDGKKTVAEGRRIPKTKGVGLFLISAEIRP